MNRARTLELIAEGRMTPNGMAELNAAHADSRWDAAHASASTATVPGDLQAALNAAPAAAAFFATLTGANRYAVLYRVTTAMRPETRQRRIVTLVATLKRGETVHG